MNQQRQIRPPKLPLRFFRWFCHPDYVEDIEGDLLERFEKRKEEGKAARWLFAVDVLRLFRPGIIKNFDGQTRLNNYGMFLNFYTSAVRNLIKHKSYFLINILGLTIGITSFVFISLFVLNELSYDRFHGKHKRIFRVSNESVIRGERNHQATTSAPMAKVLLSDYSEVQEVTRIARAGSMLVGEGEELTLEENILFSDSAFFEIFDFELVQGNPKSALQNPRSMILTETYAKKYFGDDNALGQKMVVEADDIFYTVTGVVKDPPPNSHIKFNMLGSINTYKKWNGSNWVGGGLHTYVLMKDGVDIRDFEERIHDLFYVHMAPEIEYYTGLKITEWEGGGNKVDFKLTPIADIHLKSDVTGELEPVGNITYIYVYGFIGIVILLIAIFNFVNLATAHSSTRAREVGVRKIIGSSKKLLIYQFLTESILISVLAMLVATVTVVLLERPFEALIGKELTYNLLSSHWSWVAMIGLALVIGILSGFYPSFILSGFEPISVLKGASGKTSRAGWLRDLLVTLQFSCSIVIIITVGVVYYQLDYMVSKNLGFDQEQIIVIKRPNWLGNNVEVFKNELLNNPNIQHISTSKTIPGKGYSPRSYRKKDDAETFLFLNNQVGHDYLDLFGLELTAGRFFSKRFSSDLNGVVINETAAKAFGFENPIGKVLLRHLKKIVL